jgi:hypothetical protein
MDRSASKMVERDLLARWGKMAAEPPKNSSARDEPIHLLQFR